MVIEKRAVTESLRKLFSWSRRTRPAGAVQPQDALLFDTISLQSVMTLRGQNPFPEEEGEVCSMYPRIRERPLLMR